MNVYALTLHGLIGEPVPLLITDDGRALCVPGSVTKGPARVDVTGLAISADRLHGVISLTCSPDAEFPPDRQALRWELTLNARFRTGQIEGSTSQGDVTGSVSIEVSLPAVAHWVLTIEQAAPGWPLHSGRGELIVAGQKCRLRSAIAHGWVGRIVESNLTLAGGRVRAVVGMQPGGTEVGSETVVYDLEMTRIGDVLAGACIVTGEDGRAQRRGLRGQIFAGQPRRPRPVLAATKDTLAIDVRPLRAKSSVRPWRTLEVTPARFGQMACLADLPPLLPPVLAPSAKAFSRSAVGYGISSLMKSAGPAAPPRRRCS